MNVQLPDGRILKGVPEGTTKAQLSEKLAANGIKFDEIPSATPKETTFLGDMWSNFKEGIGSTIDIAKNLGSSHPMITPQPIPKTEALADKLFAGIEEPSLAGMAKNASKNIENVKFSDVSSAINEEIGRTTPGKALNAIGGINPIYNAAGTAMSRYVNPTITKITGIHPENLKLMETALAPAGLMKTGKGTTAPATIASRVDKNLPSIIPGVGKLTEKMTKQLQTTPHLTAEQIKEFANTAYENATKQGGVLKPEFFDKFADEVQKMTPQTEEGRRLAGNSAFTVLSRKIQSLRKSPKYDSMGHFNAPEPQGRPLSLQAAQEIDEHLGDVIDSLLDNGRVTKQAAKIMDIQTNFRSMIEDSSESDVIGGKQGFESLRNGRFLWAQQAKMRDIEKIITRASMTDNPAGAVKTGFRTLYLNEKRMRGFNKEERGLIKQAAEGSPLVDFFRAWGSRLIPIGEIVSGGGFSSAVASQIMTTAARNAASRLQVSRANKIEQSISKEVQKRQAAQQPVLPNP